MTRFFSIYRVILWAALLALVIPLSAAAYYNRPILDDMTSLDFARQLGSDSGSLWGTLTACVQRAAEYWRTITGTFSVVLFYSLLWSAFGELVPRIFPLIVITLLVFASFRMIRCLRCMKPELPREVLDCTALLLAIMFILFLPNVYDGLYWTAASNYTFAFSVMACVFSSVFCRCCQSQKHRPFWRELVYLSVISTMLFLIGGGDHLNATSSLVLYGYLALWILLTGKPKRYLIPFAFLLVGFMLDIVAPGNGVRIGSKDTQPILAAFAASFVEAGQFVFRDIRYWIFLVLCLPVLAKAAAAFTVTKRYVVLFPLASLSLLASCMFPNQWSNYALSWRHTVRFFMTFCPLLFANMLVLLSYLARIEKLKRGFANTFTVKKITVGLCAAAAALMLVSMPSLSFSPFRFGTVIQSAEAAAQLADGQLKQWAEEYDSIAARLRSSPHELVALSTIPHNGLLGTPDITGDPEYWINTSFAHYYGGDDASIIYVP